MTGPRLSSLDASFLEVESQSAHMHVGWAARFSPPTEGSRPTFEQLRAHINGRMGRAPRYRQRLASVPLGANDPVWVDDERFDIERHVFRARSDEFDELVDMVMSTQLDRDRPLWEVWIADELPDGHLGVVGKAHHCMVDGLAAVELASLLLDPTPTPERGESEGWRAAPAPTGLRLLTDGVADRFGELAGLARWPLEVARRPVQVLERVERALRAARHSLEPAREETAFNDPISPLRHLATTRRSLDDLRRIKATFGTSVNDVILSVAAGGVRRFLESRDEPTTTLKTMVPVSLRAEDGGGELGNQISFVFIDLPCDEPDPVERLAAVKAEMSDRKEAHVPEGAGAVLNAFGYAPRVVQRAVSHAVSSSRAFNLVVSNIPGPPEPLYMLGCRLEEVYPVVPIADDHAVAVGFTTVGQEGFFGVYADRTSLPDADRLAEGIEESIDELLALSRG